MISIDGCMSTNDMVIIMANGEGDQGDFKDEKQREAEFTIALKFVCRELAKMIVRDAEGATKFISISVRGAGDSHQAKTVAMAVANSVLVKTAIFGRDPNWGRIAAAIGAAGIGFDPSLVDIFIGDIQAVSGGKAAQGIEAGDDIAGCLAQDEVAIGIDLKQG